MGLFDKKTKSAEEEVEEVKEAKAVKTPKVAKPVKAVTAKNGDVFGFDRGVAALYFAPLHAFGLNTLARQL